MSYQIKGADMQTTHIKDFLKQTRLKKVEIANALNVAPQQLNLAITRGTDVYIVHDGDKIIDSFLKRKWGNVL